MTITFTNAESDNFFTNRPQMALSAQVRARLAMEGLATMADFSDFKEDQLTDAFKNMRTSIPGVPGIPEQRDPNDNTVILVQFHLSHLLSYLPSVDCASRSHLLPFTSMNPLVAILKQPT